ncbi:MAG: tetratricopeptide repeat protein [Ferruginibacter sp.]
MRSFLRKFLFAGVIGLAFYFTSEAQPGTPHQLIERLRQLEKNNNYLSDTAYAGALNELAFIYADSYPDSAILLLKGHAERCKSIGFRKGETDAYTILGNAFQTKGDFKKSMDYYEQSYQLAQKIDYQTALPGILNNIGLIYLNQGNYPMALNKFYEALKAAESIKNNFVIGTTLNNIATIHFYQNKMREAEEDYQKMLKIAEGMSDTVGVIMAYNNIGEVNLEQDSAIKALHNLNTAFNLATVAKNPEMLVASTKNLGYVYYKLDSLPKAVGYFETAIGLSRQQGNAMSTSKALIGLAKTQNKMGMQKEALSNGLEGAKLAEEMGQTQLLRDASEIVATVYEALGDDKSALKYFRIFKASSDSINNSESERAAATYKAEYEFSKKELEFKRKDMQQRWLIFSALAALFSLSVIIWMINRNRKQLNIANKTLLHKNLLIETEKSKAEEALNQLKAAQSQLIQSEKMASLGELTAGIAHEIQNPLNFVNNFSELNKELLEEMKEEIGNGNFEEVKAIANDVTGNEEKINYHGKRADAIVKGMLQHSRSNSGIKELTDINALADEYLRLSYHGFRSKDKSFNAAMQIDLDQRIGQVQIISQDIGRVLLNLYNNAFYSVNEKKKVNGEGYEPAVIVSTKKIGDKISIRVKDNGGGIPERIVEKIFQPFFTTKPTGQGTGLGLSLSYDIVTKGHNGELKVETREGEGSEFVIVLPI